jgi:hypothetical protein
MSKVVVKKAVEVLPGDAFEANKVLAPEDRVDPVKSGLLKALDSEGKVVLILNEHVPEEMQEDWLKQPVTRAHRRRMSKAIWKIYRDRFTC